MYARVKPRCPACRRDDTLREQWGCDAPAERGVVVITCPACNGAGCEWEGAAGLFGGCERGKVASLRCPTALQSEDVRRLFLARDWASRGVTPHGGGWADMPCTYAQGVEAIESERAAIEREKRDREELMERLKQDATVLRDKRAREGAA